MAIHRVLSAIAALFRMTDEAWCRHANPWSVHTRLAAVPAMILAIWSRVWLGWWAWLPVAAVIVWLLLNPHVFAPVREPKNWAAKGIYGEKIWLNRRGCLPPRYGTIFRCLAVAAAAGFLLTAWGLVQLAPWAAISGGTLIVLAQLWRIDRLSRLFDEVGRDR